MNRKPHAFHLEIQTHRKNPYGLLRRSYREDGKVKKETIGRLTGLSIEQLRAMQDAIQGRTIPKDEFKIIASREYGASAACVALMRKLNLHTAISSKHTEEWVRCCLAMIAGRLVYAGSKLSLSHCSSYSALWEACGIEGPIDVDLHCYSPMDKLLDQQGAIQKKLAQKHLSGGTVVLYDITSSYMEGEYKNSELVEFGYNRDKKRGHEQIVIALLCAKDGCPVAVEIFKGNTKDGTTVLDKIDEIRKKYGLEKVIFVGDRGMMTQVQYEQLDHKAVNVISALSHGAIRSLLDKKTIQLSMFDEKNVVEVIEGDMRYCLCKNPDMAIKERVERNALLDKTKAALDKIVNSTRKTKNSKEIRAGKVVDKYNAGKFFTFIGSGNDLKYMVDEGKVEKESGLDGCYIIYTDVSAQDMTAVETVENYKSLIRVEQAFRNMKTVRLEIRPVYHKTDERIRCHVFICMLAYYVMWHMNQRLAPLYQNDGVGKKRKYTFDYIMEMLKSIRKETVEINGSTSGIVTTPTTEQKRILALLEVEV